MKKITNKNPSISFLFSRIFKIGLILGPCFILLFSCNHRHTTHATKDKWENLNKQLETSLKYCLFTEGMCLLQSSSNNNDQLRFLNFVTTVRGHFFGNTPHPLMFTTSRAMELMEISHTILPYGRQQIFNSKKSETEDGPTEIFYAKVKFQKIKGQLLEEQSSQEIYDSRTLTAKLYFSCENNGQCQILEHQILSF